jgi:hypothetical protein
MGRGKSYLEEAMKSNKEQFGKTSKRILVMASASLALWIAGGGPTWQVARGTSTHANREEQMVTTQNKFYCNVKALTPTERAHHKQLGEKLAALRKAIVETEKGYEFQFSPVNVTLAEVADWVAAESKCCPFFDFHIDVERSGSLLCLRLTGEEGIKAFIRVEFSLQ